MDCPFCNKATELPQDNFSPSQHECGVWYWKVQGGGQGASRPDVAVKKLAVYAQGLDDEADVDMSNIKYSFVTVAETNDLVVFVLDTTVIERPADMPELSPIEQFANSVTSLKRAIYGKLPDAVLEHEFGRVESTLAALKKGTLKGA